MARFCASKNGSWQGGMNERPKGVVASAVDAEFKTSLYKRSLSKNKRYTMVGNCKDHNRSHPSVPCDALLGPGTTRKMQSPQANTKTTQSSDTHPLHPSPRHAAPPYIRPSPRPKPLEMLREIQHQIADPAPVDVGDVSDAGHRCGRDMASAPAWRAKSCSKWCHGHGKTMASFSWWSRTNAARQLCMGRS
jgi:hypothetical protein